MGNNVTRSGNCVADWSELPDATLDAVVGYQDRVLVFSNQIRKNGQTGSYGEKAQRAVRNIERLAAMPGALPKAMKSLVNVADTYCQKTLACDCRADLGNNDTKILRPMDDLMVQIIRSQYTTVRASKQDWDPSELHERIETLVQDEIHAEFLTHGRRDTEGLFQCARRLLYNVVARKAAILLTHKVVGDRLPIELVEMIQDFVCNDEDLRSNAVDEKGTDK